MAFGLDKVGGLEQALELRQRHFNVELLYEVKALVQVEASIAILVGLFELLSQKPKKAITLLFGPFPAHGKIILQLVFLLLAEALDCHHHVCKCVDPHVTSGLVVSHQIKGRSVIVEHDCEAKIPMAVDVVNHGRGVQVSSARSGLLV